MADAPRAGSGTGAEPPTDPGGTSAGGTITEDPPAAPDEAGDGRPDARAGPSTADGEGAGPGGWRALARGALTHTRAEAVLGLEIMALTSFVVARPVLDSFGRSPETFLARGADAFDVVLFGLTIQFGPPLLLAAGAAAVAGPVALVARRVRGDRENRGNRGDTVRRALQALVVGVLAGAAVWQVLRPEVDWGPALSLPVCALAGAAVAALRWRTESAERFLRYAGIGSVVFLVQFAVASPTAAIVGGGRDVGIDEEATAAVQAAVGDDGPPVVLVVLDGLPTAALLDGRGRIDADLYPNLARLAGDATWYRNHTTVAQITLQAVPAILSGTVPDASAPVAGEYPHNLFTLLGGAYDVHGGERITSLCPTSLCPASGGQPVPDLVRDAEQIWRQTMTDSRGDPELIPAAFSDRAGVFTRWVDGQDFAGDAASDDAGAGPGDRPDLYVHHMLLPHASWEYLPDGTRYAGSHPPSGLFVAAWGDWGEDVARQRHVLQAQASDGLLGGLLDRLEADGTYDDALVVVTADHGYAFDEGAPWRGADERNVDDILWTPLLVKSPGQTEGDVDDRNVNTTDIVPTIADELGIDVPWELDGVPAADADRDPGDKWVIGWEWDELDPADEGSPGDGERLEVDGDEAFDRVLAADWVEGEGPLAAWQRTEHGALVGRDVAGIEAGDAPGLPVDVDLLGQWDDVDMARPPLELTATSPVPEGAAVAVAVNGVVAAVVPAEATPYGAAALHALLHPGSMRDGANELAFYLVDGDPTAPVLHPLEARAKS
jgi:hypothetical protein